MLLIENDLGRAGMGYVRELYAAALLLAMREGRVLLEVPLNQSWPVHDSRVVGMDSRIGMWCDRPPYTLQCFFSPWTHCTQPDLSTHEPIRPVHAG